MRSLRHINPDHFLPDVFSGTVSAGRGKLAWERAYAALEDSLDEVGMRGRLYVVCGLQGAGKSTWVAEHADAMDEYSVFFDAALPSRRHRTRPLVLAAASATPVSAIWLNVPVEIALQRNAQRSGAARVPEAVVYHVLEQLEPPSLEEGFEEVIEFDAQGQQVRVSTLG